MKELKELYIRHFSEVPLSVEALTPTASMRRYFRMKSEHYTAIGSFSPEVKESKAFLKYSRHFSDKGLNVPEVYAVSDDLKYYLQADLGDEVLHQWVVSRRDSHLDQDLYSCYKTALAKLIEFQVEGHAGLDYTGAVPRESFDQQAVLWDLNHFKYYFLKLSGIPFDEQKLENAFAELAERIASLDGNYFMFRDFQSRNIMLKSDELYFIDFQGGRKGPLMYDVASLLFESKARISAEDRKSLLGYYLEILAKKIDIDKEAYAADFYLLALIRILQALGAYGLRGKVEKLPVFLQSIPHGLKNLSTILSHVQWADKEGYFIELLEKLAASSDTYPQAIPQAENLTVSVTSFSYRKPLPDDLSGNGGGFIYDCRYIKNPGREEAFKHFTGLDKEIDTYFGEVDEMAEFLSGVKEQLTKVIGVYKARGFKHLSVSFGCTGGQHRSVYSTKTIAAWLRTLDLVVFEKHRELGISYGSARS